MAGLLDGKQLKDGSVTPNKLSEQYIPVHEGGEGDKFLSDDGTYKEIPVVELPSIALSDKVLTCDAAGLKAHITLVTDGNQVRIEGKIGEDGEPVVVGEFNVLQSQIIEKAEVINDHLFITFLVDGDPGTETVDIDLSRFIDVYEGSEYVDVNGNIITLDYETLHDKLLNDSFIKVTSLADYYTKGDVDDLIAGIESVPHADTADRLTTARTINGVAFDGTKDITFHSLYPERIPANADLNDYTQPGMYYCPLDVDVETLQNTPTTYAFSLLIERQAGSSESIKGVIQTLKTYTQANQVITKIYYRCYYYSTGWSEWQQAITDTTSELVLKDTHETYINLDLTGKRKNIHVYSKRVLLLHPLDADIYPADEQGSHSVQGEFYFNRYQTTKGAATTTIKIDSCTGYSLTWGYNPSMSIINGGGSSFLSSDEVTENTVSFCEVMYEGTRYRAIYLSGIQRPDALSFSGKVFNIDDNFGRLVGYYRWFNYSEQIPVNEILNEEIYESIELIDLVYPEQHILVGSASVYGNMAVGRKKSIDDGKAGVVIRQQGGIEICHESTPFIDFHYANSTADYTSRIIEVKEGRLAVPKTLQVGTLSTQELDSNINLYVHNRISTNSIITRDPNGIYLDFDQNVAGPIRTMLRTDSDNFYVLFSDRNGTGFNTFRPFHIRKHSGEVVMKNGVHITEEGAAPGTGYLKVDVPVTIKGDVNITGDLIINGKKINIDQL